MRTHPATAERISAILLCVLMVLAMLPLLPETVLSTKAYGDTETISATIRWIDDNASDRPAPETVAGWLHLLGNDAEVTEFTPQVTKSDDNTYSVLYNGLPGYSDPEQTITINYQIKEVIPEAYADQYSSSSSFSGDTTIFTNLRLTSVPVSKEWVGIDTAGRTADIALWQYVENETVEIDTGLVIQLDGTAESNLGSGSGAYAGVRYGEDSAWHGLFSRLPAFDEHGHAITYFVTENGESPSGEESALEGCYSPVITGDMNRGFTVKNIANKTCSIHVRKVWHGTSEKVTVNLLADGQEFLSVEMDGTVDVAQTVPDYNLTYGETAGWVAAFDGLPKYHPQDGHEIKYTVSEQPISGVSTDISKPQSVSGNASLVQYTITNTRLVTITFKKTWNVSEAITTSDVTVGLEQYDAETGSWKLVSSVAQIKLDGTEQPTAWAGSFTNVPGYDENGNQIRYRVVETNVPDGFICSGVTGNMTDGFTISNVKATELRFQKSWFEAVPEGASATFQLYRSTDGTRYGSANSTAKPWGPAITLDGQKDAAAVQDPDTGVETQEYENDWYGRFFRLPIDSPDGEVYTYSVRETASVDGYAAFYDFSSDPASVMNYPSKEIGVTKQWCGGTAQPVSIGVFMVRSGSADENALYTVRLDGTADEMPDDPGIGIFGYEDRPWHAVFLNVPDISEASYTVAETDTLDGFVSKLITDSHGIIVDRKATIQNISAANVELKVEKSWKGKIPENASVTLQLFRSVDGSLATDTETSAVAWGPSLTLDGSADPEALTDEKTGVRAQETGKWEAVFGQLPECDEEGHVFTYSVKETACPEGFTASYEHTDAENAQGQSETVTNTSEGGSEEESSNDPGDSSESSDPEENSSSESDPEPSEPGQNDSSQHESSQGNEGHTDTGDVSGAALYLILFLCAIVAAFLLVRLRAQRNKAER